jgi:hypothetical protein
MNEVGPATYGPENTEYRMGMGMWNGGTLKHSAFQFSVPCFRFTPVDSTRGAPDVSRTPNAGIDSPLPRQLAIPHE